MPEPVDNPLAARIDALLPQTQCTRCGYPDCHAYAQALAADEAAPDRCVWASDWPHPVSVVQPPNDADLLELMYRYAPDEATLEKIMVRNPAKLFGLPG
jgi:predicted TIM-barrel fold metal-dependent hydrolase